MGETVEIDEGVLTSRVWIGKNSRYHIKIHISRHCEVFNGLEQASQHIAYSPPNETSRVRYLLNSIQTNDTTICSAKTPVMADVVKKNDFEEAADFIMITALVPKFYNDRNDRISALKFKRE